ncbi:MAG TPA: SRPBCC domain-containing protein [Thermoanaerobaculia bacterium]|nr:SRPBCC domain-containing protein [Thermoanaerobaculia bacterium]
MPNVTHVARFHVPPERVYRAIAATDYLRQWWMQEAQLEAKAAGAARLEGICRSVDARVRLEDQRPPASVRWKTVPVTSSMLGWERTTIAFDLRAAEGGTQLALTHGGFEHADEDYLRTAAGWACCLLGLQRDLEAGIGKPRAIWTSDVFRADGVPPRPLTMATER